MTLSSLKNPEKARRATERRRREIMDAALERFLENGVAATTIEEIRAVSGASTGSIYHLFGNKDEIAFALFVEGMREYHRQVLDAAKRKRSARSCLRAIIATHLQLCVEQPQLCLYLTRQSMADGSDEILQEYHAANDRFAHNLFTILEPFIETGEIVRLPPELYLSLIVGPSAYLSRSWLRGRYDGDPLAAAGVLAHAAWNSLRAERTDQRK
ncbi:MAG: TetR/AcrR family transcriptional regulator [Planctomycetales bacterium]|nr:TetR/AcrR family transcriptional regulator [Planctomycetales bacterium]